MLTVWSSPPAVKRYFPSWELARLMVFGYQVHRLAFINVGVHTIPGWETKQVELCGFPSCGNTNNPICKAKI